MADIVVISDEDSDEIDNRELLRAVEQFEQAQK